MDALPPVSYAKSNDVYIAYTQCGQVGGEDVVLTAGSTNLMEFTLATGDPAALGEHARVTWFDKRGIGRSDGAANFTFEERMDDIRAVMDAADIESAHLAGSSEGGPLSILFAATYPDRVKSLSLYGTFPAFMRKADYPHGLDMSLGEYGRFVDRMVDATLGDLDAVRWVMEMAAPTYATDEEFIRAAVASTTDSPSAVRQVWENLYEIDVRHVLSSIHVPTTVVHKTGDQLIPVEGGRYIAEHIPGAKLIELPGVDHARLEPLPEFSAAIIDHIRRASAPMAMSADRRLATVVFTDIVDSTPAASSAGDEAWTRLLDRHDSLSKGIIAEHLGELIKTTGDGVLATFDGPSRAVYCASALHTAMAELGLPIRAGLHTGEIERRDADIAGLAVHIAARVTGLASAGETVVSSTVKDLVVGAGFTFEDRGEHELKGIENEWRCYALTGPAPGGQR